MRNVRVAMWLIWGGYATLALAIALFAITVRLLRLDIGVVFSATLLLGVVGTAAGLVLLGGAVLGTHAVVRQRACRRPSTVITVLAGLIGATFLGWTAWGFWTQ